MKTLSFISMIAVLMSQVSWASTPKTIEVPFQGFKIKISEKTNSDRTVYAHIDVYKDTLSIASKEFKNIDSLGGFGQLFLPKKQPLQNLYLIGKMGDYDSRLLAITAEGALLDLPLGESFVDDGVAVLWKNTVSEPYPEVAVLNLNPVKLIASEKGTQAKPNLEEGHRYSLMKSGATHYLKGIPGEESGSKNPSFIRIDLKTGALSPLTSEEGKLLDKKAKMAKRLLPKLIYTALEPFRE